MSADDLNLMDRAIKALQRLVDAIDNLELQELEVSDDRKN